MGPEITTLLDRLNSQRRGALTSVEGLSEDDLRRPVLPSGWTCAGLFQHLTVNERYWLRWAVAGEDLPGTRVVDGRCQVVLEDMPDPDDDWAVAPHLDTRTVLDRYRDEIALADVGLANLTTADLDGPPRRVDPPWQQWFGDGINVRWVVLHMIEETAQHGGHLDVVREILDAGAPARS